MPERLYNFAVSEFLDDRQTDTSIRLRAATPADAPFAFFVKKHATGPYIAATWGWCDEEQLSYHQREYMPELVRILMLGGTDIGTVSVTSDGGRVLLAMLYLLPDYQRKGIGTHIVRAVQAQAQLDHLPVQLAVLKVNPAQALYRRLGFAPMEETKTHLKMQWWPPVGRVGRE